MLPVVTVFLKEIPGSSSHNWKLLASDLPLERCLISMYKRRRLCSASISSQSCMNRRELRACTLMWLILFITSCKTLSSGDIFQLASICPWMTVCRLTFRGDHFDQYSENQNTVQSWQPLHPCTYQHKMTSWGFLICGHSETWIVLQLSCWLARKVHITHPHAHSPEKHIAQKQAKLPCGQHQ